MLGFMRVLLCALLVVLSSASVATAAEGQRDHLVPIGGTVVGLDVEPDMTALGCTPVGAPLLWRFTSEGTGTVSHLGRVTYHFTHCTHVDLTITEGELALTAANGDTLVLDYTARVTQYTPGDPVAVWEQEWTVADGTGRFAGATGSGVGEGMTYLPPLGSTELRIAGTIAYDASNRSTK